jgi:hypothetical protein
MLLRAGISYRQFDEIAREAFVEECLGSRPLDKKQTNVSRIAVRTGLSRKVVARVRDDIESRSTGTSSSPGIEFRSGYPARILQVWHSEAGFLGPGGRPRDLTFDVGSVSFSTLVKFVGGDVPAGAVRAELVAAGAVEELPDGTLRALKRHFIPGDLGEELVVGFRLIAAPVLNGLAHNASVPKSDAYIQRVSYSENLPASKIATFRELAHERAAEFVLSMDKWLDGKERTSADTSSEPHRVGVGVFYFEEPQSNNID